MYTSTILTTSTLITLLILLPLISCFPAPVSLDSLLAESESNRLITLSSRSPEPKKHHHHGQADPARPLLPNGAVANAFVRARSAQSASAAAAADGGPTFGAATGGEEDGNELFERDGVTGPGKGQGDDGTYEEEGEEEEGLLEKRDHAALAAVFAAFGGASAKGNGNAVAQAGK